MKPIIVEPLAEAEIEEIYLRYESIRTGLDVEFLSEVARTADFLSRNLKLYQRVVREMGRALLDRFHCGLIYV